MEASDQHDHYRCRITKPTKGAGESVSSQSVRISGTIQWKVEFLNEPETVYFAICL